MDAKTYLIETLEYYKQRVINDSCTMEEMNSATRAIEQNIKVHGTISDFAEFYGKPENQVRATISKKLIAKPKRLLLYPFHEFLKIIPGSWNKKEG